MDIILIAVAQSHTLRSMHWLTELNKGAGQTITDKHCIDTLYGHQTDTVHR